MPIINAHVFIFAFLMAAACSPKLQPYSPAAPPPVIYSDEPSLNAALKKAEPFSALGLVESHPQFASPRVQIILLETLAELGRYAEACAVGEKLLALPKTPKVFRKASSAGRNTAKKTRAFPEYLTESQRHKVYFNLAIAYEGLTNLGKAQEYFEKTVQRPNYYYLYRYAQNRLNAGDQNKALFLLKQSYERSKGNFAYVNDSYARLLTLQAFKVYKKSPQEAKEKLALVLGEDKLKNCPASARAEILWSQWF